MTTPNLHSIVALKPEDVIPTGAKPVRVFCNNWNYYLLKHEKIGISQLVNEYLAASFLKIWELSVPCFAFVTVKAEHIPVGLHADLQPHFFYKPGFGSWYGRNWSEVDKMTENIAVHQKHLFAKKLELLEIALFDLWVANEDRNANNYNLLLMFDTQYRFIPIDHQAIFNYDNLEQPLTPLAAHDSLLSTPLINHLFSKKELPGVVALLKTSFFRKVQRCQVQTAETLQQLPPFWQINTTKTHALLEQNLFEMDWLQQAWTHFELYLEAALHRH